LSHPGSTTPLEQCHGIAEILLKVALNTINQIKSNNGVVFFALSHRITNLINIRYVTYSPILIFFGVGDLTETSPKKSYFFQFSIFTPDMSDFNVLSIYDLISKVMTFSAKRIACSKQSNLGTFSLVGT
jgi:hypothetical protein